MSGVHRLLLAAVLFGNTLAFAGVDPIARWATALVVLLMVIAVPDPPEMPKAARWAVLGFLVLVAFQLMPLPGAFREVLQPGFSEVISEGWRPLSLAPWSTIVTAGSLIVAAAIAMVTMQITATRSGLPLVLTLLAATGCLLAVLGLIGEAGASEKVLLVRDNTAGGSVYGPFVNSNHFAVAVELTLPAALVMLVAAGRNLRHRGAVSQRAVVSMLAWTAVIVVAGGALLRSSSRGGVLFLAVALVLTAGWWMRRRLGRRWPWVLLLLVVASLVLVLAWTQVPDLQDGFAELLVLEGVDGNTRWDLWAATLRSFARSPLVGSGLGSYRYVIGLDKPATGTAELRQAHNDWLEWLATTGVLGGFVLCLAIAGLVRLLAPGRVRRLRHELRYPLAGAALAMVAVSLHEVVGFGLQTPLNRYLLAVWIGLVLGVSSRLRKPWGGGGKASGSERRAGPDPNGSSMGADQSGSRAGLAEEA